MLLSFKITLFSVTFFLVIFKIKILEKQITGHATQKPLEESESRENGFGRHELEIRFDQSEASFSFTHLFPFAYAFEKTKENKFMNLEKKILENKEGKE